MLILFKMKGFFRMKKNLSIVCLMLLIWSFGYEKVEARDVGQPKAVDTSKMRKSIDSWMPDKNLQRAVALNLDVEVSDLTKELLQTSDVSVSYRGTVDQAYLSKYFGEVIEMLDEYQSIKDFTGLEYAKSVYLDIAAMNQDDFKKVKVPKDIRLVSVSSMYSLGNKITDIVDFYQTCADRFTFKDYFDIYLSQSHAFVSDPLTLTQTNYRKFTIDTKKYWRGVSEFSTLDTIELDEFSDCKFFSSYGGMIVNYIGTNSIDYSEPYLVYQTSIDDNYNVTFELDAENSTYSTNYADLKGKTTATDSFYEWRDNVAFRDYQGVSFKTAEGVDVEINCYPQFLIPLSFQ